MNEESILTAALDIQSPTQRRAFLEEACGGNSALRASVEQLISAHQDAGGFLETPILSQRERSETVPDRSSWESIPPTNDTTSRRPASNSLPHADQLVGAEPLDFVKPVADPTLLGMFGPYAVSEIIGRGGMGIVLKALDSKLNRMVAIKVLAPELASNVMARRRFLREGQAAAAISHPHVVTTHAIDEVDHLPYIVMEYVQGRSLQERIDQDGPLDVTRILRIARQTALGLAAAHEQGLIHRDVKPANILLENGIERVKLSDFGLARAIDDVSTTRTGTVAGTPQYMSPEQARGEWVDHRSDLFSLGCVMYAMCTGRSPFRADSTLAALRRVCEDEPRRIDHINPAIPGWLIAVVQRLLAKRPEDRFQSAAEIVSVLGKGLACAEDPTHSLPPELDVFAHAHAIAEEPHDWSHPCSPGATVMLEETCPSRRSGKETRRSRFVMMATIFVGMLCAAVGITEATGLSDLQQYVTTVLRIGTSYGTLILEVEDPSINVMIGGEEVVITGAGPQEVRLKPGVHLLSAQKGGRVVTRELVNISRDGKQLVRVGYEPTSETRRKVEVETRDKPVPSDPLYQFDEIGRFVGDARVQYTATFSPADGQVLTLTSAGHAAQLLELPQLSELLRFGGEFGAGRFTPDGRRIVTGSYRQGGDADANRLEVWDSESGTARWSSSEVTGVFHDLAVSVDGSVAVSGHGQWWGDYQERDHSVRVWSLEEKRLHRRITGHTDQVMAVAITPDNKYCVSGSRDRTVRLWDLATGTKVRRFDGVGTEVFAVAVSPDGRFVLAGYGPDVESGIHDGVIDDPEHCVAVMWERETGEEIRRFQGHHGCIRSAKFSPRGELIVTASGEAYVGEPTPDGSSKKSRDNSVRLWDTSTGRELARMEHRTSVTSAGFSSDGSLLLTAQWQLVHLWQVPTTLHDAKGTARGVASLPPLLISSNRSGNFEIYRVDSRRRDNPGVSEVAGREEHEWSNLTDHAAEDTGPAWSPDGAKIAFCSSRSGNLDIWTMNANGSDPRQLTDFPGIDRTPCWSPDGKRIAFVRHLTRDNWEIFVMRADGSDEVNLTNHPGKESDPAWSPSGERIAYSFDFDGTRLYLMNADGSDPRLLSGRKGSYLYPAWSPDGSQLVFTGWDEDVGSALELFVVDVDGGQERQLTDLQGLNTYATWSPDGQRIAFEHRDPNIPGRKATVMVMNVDGSALRPVGRDEAHVGYGGGRPAWQPLSVTGS